MARISTSKTRHIIEDFVREIDDRKQDGPVPSKAVIDFRNERRDGVERPVWHVPIDLLRYRKDNGRIASDILSYEKDEGPLNETTEEAQRVIRRSLERKDPEKTADLKRSVQHAGQREPAIVTCDGFLINGNRRKMVLEMLVEEGKTEFRTLKVVILPGKGDKGGPPTLLEIEEIENRYQLQSEGKAEYSNFDRALSMRRKIQLGMTLEEQLRDDPSYAALAKSELAKRVKELTAAYLSPLECVDRYLEHLKREGVYSTVASGIGDREGRWQAFLDYYRSVYAKLADKKQRARLNIREEEVGTIELAAFNVIRMRDLKGVAKVHEVMRRLPKWLDNPDSKKQFVKLADIDVSLPSDRTVDDTGHEYDDRTIDKLWAEEHATEIVRAVKTAKDLFEHKRVRETPLSLLDAALKKLNHEGMRPRLVPLSDWPAARALTAQLKSRADELEKEFYEYQKAFKKLKDKHK